ncbi:uncharacterized protein LOC134655628 [Cydia amplana]|uniref:uncharacterized protein LOC134655628 n=1 Tax=Cydia amplana TaxID=1869771 RepID=UPI002FE5934E
MVLLSPSVSALKMLLAICERFSVAHGLKYNVTKSELLVFKSGTKTYTIPPITLSRSPLQTVQEFKYLSHWVTDTLKDDVDLERERRALSIRGNMLARRFARCSHEVKIALFKTYCQMMYTCSLWSNYTEKAFSALRVQYNNAFRGLLGLPWRCSASGMFAENGIDGFQAVLRKRVASLWVRTRGSTNTLLRVIARRMDSPIISHWMGMHVQSNKNFKFV